MSRDHAWFLGEVIAIAAGAFVIPYPVGVLVMLVGVASMFYRKVIDA